MKHVYIALSELYNTNLVCQLKYVQRAGGLTSTNSGVTLPCMHVIAFQRMTATTYTLHTPL